MPNRLSSAPLQFNIAEGRTLNAFYQQGPVAAHLLLNSGTQPRVLVAFHRQQRYRDLVEPAKVPVQWTLEETHALEQADAKGRPLHGIVATASIDAPLVVRDAVLGGVRILRDYQIDGRYPSKPQPPPHGTATRLSGRDRDWMARRVI